MEIKLDSLINKNLGEIRINISVKNHPDELWRRFAGVDTPRLIPQIGRAGHIRSHCMMCYTVRKKKCSPLFWYKAIIVWFSQFIMTVVQN